MQHFRFTVPTLREHESFRMRARQLDKQLPRQSGFNQYAPEQFDAHDTMNLAARLNRLPGAEAGRVGSVFPDGFDGPAYRPARVVRSSLENRSGRDLAEDFLALSFRVTRKQLWSDMAAGISRAVQRNL